MVIDKGGNVGIGTTGPTLGKLTIDMGAVNDYILALNSNVTGAGHWIRFTESSAEKWVIGHIGSGVTGRVNNFAIVNGSGTSVLELQPGGNVGIGDTTPTYKLDVAGTGRFTSNLTGLGFFYSSDESLKQNVQEIETPLAKIMKLDGISFNWKENGKKSMGLIAQDVEKVFPEIVQTEDRTGLKSVEYAKLVAPLIEAVKEQQKMIDEQKELINQQGEEIKMLKALFE